MAFVIAGAALLGAAAGGTLGYATAGLTGAALGAGVGSLAGFGIGAAAVALTGPYFYPCEWYPYSFCGAPYYPTVFYPRRTYLTFAY
jgi:hypothetical protein